MGGLRQIILLLTESVAGKRVVLTGASSGMGEQMAYHYARMGADILITARREYRLQEVSAAASHKGQTINDRWGASGRDFHFTIFFSSAARCLLIFFLGSWALAIFCSEHAFSSRNSVPTGLARS